MPAVRNAESKDISSDSVLEFDIEPCYLQNQEIGTYVFGPIKHKIAPDALLLLFSQLANDASANNASWMSYGGSPTQHCISRWEV